MKIISKKKFQKLNQVASNQECLKIKILIMLLTKLFVNADKNYRWLHQNTWMDEPILNHSTRHYGHARNYIYKSRPEYIIETGVAWGGSTIVS
jgi:cephalosporin hydroxylase